VYRSPSKATVAVVAFWETLIMWSNYAALVDAPIPRVFHIADHRRRATEQWC
jgi:hypothetical protein